MLFYQSPYRLATGDQVPFRGLTVLPDDLPTGRQQESLGTYADSPRAVMVDHLQAALLSQGDRVSVTLDVVAQDGNLTQQTQELVQQATSGSPVQVVSQTNSDNSYTLTDEERQAQADQLSAYNQYLQSVNQENNYTQPYIVTEPVFYVEDLGQTEHQLEHQSQFISILQDTPVASPAGSISEEVQQQSDTFIRTIIDDETGVIIEIETRVNDSGGYDVVSTNIIYGGD